MNAQDRGSEILPAFQAQRICGWCRMELAPGTQPATYAICPRCYVRLEQDAKWHEEGRARR